MNLFVGQKFEILVSAPDDCHFQAYSIHTVTKVDYFKNSIWFDSDDETPWAITGDISFLGYMKEHISDKKIQGHRDMNVGSSNYATMSIQPWDIWKAWKLNPWDADIVKRIGRTKEIPGMSKIQSRMEDYQKIKHICDERINHLEEDLKNEKS